MASLLSADATQKGLRTLEPLTSVADLHSLVSLNVALNSIYDIRGIENFHRLQHFSAERNAIDEFCLLAPLAACRQLQSVTLLGNPVSRRQGYRTTILALVPWLIQLDGEQVHEDERSTAWQRHAQTVAISLERLASAPIPSRAFDGTSLSFLVTCSDGSAASVRMEYDDGLATQEQPGHLQEQQGQEEDGHTARLPGIPASSPSSPGSGTGRSSPVSVQEVDENIDTTREVTVREAVEKAEGSIGKLHASPLSPLQQDIRHILRQAAALHDDAGSVNRLSTPEPRMPVPFSARRSQPSLHLPHNTVQEEGGRGGYEETVATARAMHLARSRVAALEMENTLLRQGQAEEVWGSPSRGAGGVAGRALFSPDSLYEGDEGVALVGETTSLSVRDMTHEAQGQEDGRVPDCVNKSAGVQVDILAPSAEHEKAPTVVPTRVHVATVPAAARVALARKLATAQEAQGGEGQATAAGMQHEQPELRAHTVLPVAVSILQLPQWQAERGAGMQDAGMQTEGEAEVAVGQGDRDRAGTQGARVVEEGKTASRGVKQYSVAAQASGYRPPRAPPPAEPTGGFLAAQPQGSGLAIESTSRQPRAGRASLLPPPPGSSPVKDKSLSRMNRWAHASAAALSPRKLKMRLEPITDAHDADTRAGVASTALMAAAAAYSATTQPAQREGEGHDALVSIRGSSSPTPTSTGLHLDPARWMLFAQAQVETLLLLRQAHARLLKEYDEAKEEIGRLRAQPAPPATPPPVSVCHVSTAAQCDPVVEDKGVRESRMRGEGWMDPIQGKALQQETEALRGKLATAVSLAGGWQEAFVELQARYEQVLAGIQGAEHRMREGSGVQGELLWQQSLRD